jgi:hypothetical protein
MYASKVCCPSLCGYVAARALSEGRACPLRQRREREAERPGRAPAARRRR